jgi:hypothetical protein
MFLSGTRNGLDFGTEKLASDIFEETEKKNQNQRSSIARHLVISFKLLRLF